MSGWRQWARGLCLGLLLIWMFPFCAAAAEAPKTPGEQRVFDQAGLFEDQEKKELEELIARERENIGMDLAVVTAFRQEGSSSRASATDFDEERGQGEDSEDNGA